MRYKITGRNINVTPGLKAAVEDRKVRAILQSGHGSEYHTYG